MCYQQLGKTLETVPKNRKQLVKTKQEKLSPENILKYKKWSYFALLADSEYFGHDNDRALQSL